VGKMLIDIEILRLKQESLNLGEAIAYFMEGKNVVGIFSASKKYENSFIMKHTRFLFGGTEYDTCHTFDPSDSDIPEDHDITTYDGGIMIDFKFNQKKNHIKFRKTTTIEFGKDKFIPVLYVMFEFDLSENDDDLFDGYHITDGICEWKKKHNLGRKSQPCQKISRKKRI
jgi:hypothetical protein